MVERLHGEGNGILRAGVNHAGVSDTSAHLDKTVEAASVTLWAGLAIGVEGDVNKSRPNLLTFVLSDAKTLERA